MTTEWLHFCIFIVLFKVVVDGKICRVWRQLALIFLQKKCFLTPLTCIVGEKILSFFLSMKLLVIMVDKFFNNTCSLN